MRIFKQENKELKDFEEIILDIEKERDTISWSKCSGDKTACGTLRIQRLNDGLQTGALEI